MVWSTVDLLIAIVTVERKHEASLGVLHLLVFSHYVGEPIGRNIFDPLFIVEIIYRNTLVLESEEEEKELVLFVLVVLYLLIHLR